MRNRPAVRGDIGQVPLIQFPVQALGTPSLGANGWGKIFEGGDQSQAAQGRLEDPILGYVKEPSSIRQRSNASCRSAAGSS